MNIEQKLNRTIALAEKILKKRAELAALEKEFEKLSKTKTTEDSTTYVIPIPKTTTVTTKPKSAKRKTTKRSTKSTKADRDAVVGALVPWQGKTALEVAKETELPTFRVGNALRELVTKQQVVPYPGVAGSGTLYRRPLANAVEAEATKASQN